MRRVAVWLLGVAAVGSVLAGVRWLESVSERPASEAPPAAAAPRSEPSAPPAASPEAPGADTGTGAPDAPADLAADLSGTWEAVDLEAVRRALPDNLYWEMASPTDDYRMLQEREEERARWNEAYGKVLSGTGSEDEIRAYFAHRERLSSDYIDFVTYVLDHHGRDIPERDVGLLELARTLHRKRLEELPRKLEEAFERKRAQDAAREAWLAEEAEQGKDAPE